ncbi:MAG TPA: LptF/LptG family permease [Myxococcaceae bacterium]|nr:LptF/LptG family permease [Myxococcaceae bacterium]
MKLVHRYVLGEILVPLALWVVFLFLILLVLQFLRGTDVLLGSAVRGWDLLWMLAYLTPQFLLMAVPVALLLAILIGMGRLSEDREVAALQAVGTGPLQLLVAPLLVGVVLCGLMGFLGTRAVPWGLAEMKVLINDVIKRNVVGDVKPGVFYEDLSQLTLYAEEVSGTGWRHVLLHDSRDPESPLLVLARQGAVDAAGGGAALELRLFQGEVHRDSVQGGDYALLEFEEGRISVGLESAIQRKNRYRSPKEELTPDELRAAAVEAEAAGEDGRPFLIAWHERWAQALLPLAFCLLGTPLALGRRGGGRSGGRGFGFLLTLFAYVAYYVMVRGSEQLALRELLPIWLAAHLTNLVFAGIGGLLLWRMSHRGTAG